MGPELVHGSGRTRSDREGRSELLDEPACVATAWAPNPYQRRILAVDRGFVFGVGGLGSGKSEASALKLLMWAHEHPRRRDGRPTRWFAIAPEFALIRLEMFPKILDHARRLEGLGFGSVVKRVVYGQEPRIVLSADQEILGRSDDEPDKMRGFEIEGAWGDEAQRWRWKTFRVAVSRMRSAAAVRFTISASPEDAPGWLWKIVEGQSRRFNRIREELKGAGAGLWVHRWASSDNPSNEPGTLGVIGAVLDANPDAPEPAEGEAVAPSVLQAQELGGRFPGTHEAPSLGAIDYSRGFSEQRLVLSADEARASVLGVDVGETEDFTWFTVLSARGVVLYMERWNVGTPGVPRSTFYAYLEDRIAQVAHDHGCSLVVIDSSKAGKPIVHNLEARRADQRAGKRVLFQVVGVETGAGRRKAEAIESLGVAMMSGDVRIAPSWVSPAGNVVTVEWVGWLRKEFEDLVITNVSQGKRTFNHRVGGHDDGVVSLALAWNGLSTLPRPAPAAGLHAWRQPGGGGGGPTAGPYSQPPSGPRPWSPRR